MKPNTTAELERWSRVHEEASAIEEFWDWLVRRHEGQRGLASIVSIKDQIYEFYSIDPQKLETERRALLNKLQTLRPSLAHLPAEMAEPVDSGRSSA